MRQLRVEGVGFSLGGWMDGRRCVGFGVVVGYMVQGIRQHASVCRFGLEWDEYGGEGLRWMLASFLLAAIYIVICCLGVNGSICEPPTWASACSNFNS